MARTKNLLPHYRVTILAKIPVTRFADDLRQSKTHFTLIIGEERVRVPIADVITVRRRDQRTFQALNPHLHAGVAGDIFFEVFYLSPIAACTINAHSVSADVDKNTGMVEIVDTQGGVTHACVNSIDVKKL